MADDYQNKQYDLEDRTLAFARRIRAFVKELPKSPGNIEDIRQLIRSSGSVGANYIEANESLGKKDFLHKIKICRKEAKESQYWLELLDSAGNLTLKESQESLKQEALELRKIFGAIVQKSS